MPSFADQAGLHGDPDPAHMGMPGAGSGSSLDPDSLQSSLYW